MDEGSASGFEVIAEARQYLLDLGRNEEMIAKPVKKDRPPTAKELKTQAKKERRLQKREGKRAKRKALEEEQMAIEGEETVEIVDGKEVIKIGDLELEPIDQGMADRPPIDLKEYDRLLEPDQGSHVLAPVSQNRCQSVLFKSLTCDCVLTVSS